MGEPWTRKEVIGDAELYLGNCLEVLPALGAVDHIITDPPYEDELHNAIGRIRRNDGQEMISDLGFDGINASRLDVAKAVAAVSAGWAIIFTYPVNSGRQGEHPTEKPVPLMAELVSLYTNRSQSVCDPFMGSGTTGVACLKTGRRFIGIEQNPKWFDLSLRRLEAAYSQPDIFIEADRAKPVQEPLFAEDAA